MTLPALLLPMLLGAVTPLDDARAALVRCDVDAAVAAGEKARAADPASRDALKLLAAIYDSRGDQVNARRIYKALKALPATREKPGPALAVPADLAVGKKRYVAATRARLRLFPRPDAEPLEELHVNDEALVEDIRNEWIQVTVTSEGTELSGWVHAGLTSAARTGWEQALNAARAREKSGDWAEAMKQYDVALDVNPAQAEVVVALRNAAVKAGNYNRVMLSCASVEAAEGAADLASLAEQLKAVSASCRRWFGEEPYNAERETLISEGIIRDCGACEKLRERVIRAGGAEADLPTCTAD